MIQIFSPCGWALNWQLLDNWDSWTFSPPFSQIHSCFNAPWGSSFMNASPCSTTNSVQHNTFTRCVPVVREFGVWSTWQGWRNITRMMEHHQSLIPAPTYPSHHVSSWITNWKGRCLLGEQTNMSAPHKQRHSCLSVWVHVLWSPRVPTPVWYYGLSRVGLDAGWVEGDTSAGQEGVIQPLLALSQYLPSGSGFGGGMVSLRGHIPTLLSKVVGASSPRGC